MTIVLSIQASASRAHNCPVSSSLTPHTRSRPPLHTVLQTPLHRSRDSSRLAAISFNLRRSRMTPFPKASQGAQQSLQSFEQYLKAEDPDIAVVLRAFEVCSALKVVPIPWQYPSLWCCLITRSHAQRIRYKSSAAKVTKFARVQCGTLATRSALRGCKACSGLAHSKLPPLGVTSRRNWTF